MSAPERLTVAEVWTTKAGVQMALCLTKGCMPATLETPTKFEAGDAVLAERTGQGRWKYLGRPAVTP